MNKEERSNNNTEEKELQVRAEGLGPVAVGPGREEEIRSINEGGGGVRQVEHVVKTRAAGSSQVERVELILTEFETVKDIVINKNSCNNKRNKKKKN